MLAYNFEGYIYHLRKYWCYTESESYLKNITFETSQEKRLHYPLCLFNSFTFKPTLVVPTL